MNDPRGLAGLAAEAAVAIDNVRLSQAISLRELANHPGIAGLETIS